jgi:hypothetical protein
MVFAELLSGTRSLLSATEHSTPDNWGFPYMVGEIVFNRAAIHPEE